MKNVLYIGAFELPDKNAAAHRVLNNAKCFNSLGIHTIFLDMQKNEFESEYEILSDGIEIYHRKYPKNFFDYLVYSFSIKEFKKIMKKHKEIDAVIVYNIFSLTFLRILLYCKLNKVKIISDCTEWYSSSFFNIIKKIDVIFRMQILNRLCDGIIVISKFLENFYQNSITVKIPPLIDKTNDKWNKNITSCNSHRIVFSYCGIPGKKERLDLFINALSSDEFKKYSFSFNIAGINEKDFRKKFPKINDVNFGNKINFLGLVSHDKALDIMKNSNYGIILRENNKTNNAGFPTKFVEYNSIGVPVIISHFSNVDEYCTDSDLIVEEISENSIKSVLNQIFFNRNKIKEKDSSMVFHYEKYIDKFESFFKQIES